MPSESNMVYAPPHFLPFTRQRTLMAQRFDPSSLALRGNPVPIAEDVLLNPCNAGSSLPEGSSTPRWRRDGRELFYVAREGRVMAVSLVAEDALTIGKTTHLFTVPVAGSFDVTPDGQRFLFNVESPPGPITVVLNWKAAFDRRVGDR